MQPTPIPSDSRQTRNVLVALLAYTLLLLWGSLYPFTGWQHEAETLGFLSVWSHSRLSAPDLVVNALIYIPLGVCVRLLAWRRSAFPAVLLATAYGAALSFGVEATQAHLPQRVSSLSDFALNTGGALFGACFASALNPGGRIYTSIGRWRKNTFQPGAEADLALAALAGWALSQLSPFVPSFDLGSLRSGLAPLAAVVTDPARFSFPKALTTALEIFALALLARDARLHGVSLTRTLFILVFGVLMAKVVIISRQLSAEALVGGAFGLVLALGSPRSFKPLRSALCATAITFALCISELTPEAGPLRVLNRIPFAAHLNNPMLGLSVIIDSMWPYLVLTAALHRVTAVSPIGTAAIVVICTLFSLSMEWMQQYIPGRTPDVTTTAIALVTAVLAVRHVRRHVTAPSSSRHARFAATLLAIILLSGATTVWSLGRPQPAITSLSQSKQMLPAPDELIEPSLPGFKKTHPRLPYPSASDIARMHAENPGYIRELLNRARGGKGDIDDAIQAAVLEPGSQDVRLIVERVLALKPTWRGHEQTKPIALAYDWLHSSIPPDLLPKLQDKVVNACNYQIEVIRTERLSPYNVFLYNSPLQALMACSLAIYGDVPRAGPAMAFTHDYWMNRVLPAWRQIGGRNGGWHEGGEYVGIGIGQAIYSLPAMWRSATGEDFIAGEPAIRGFLDFVVQRRTPDGASMPWGDTSFTRRQVNDAVTLSIEYRDATAYAALGTNRLQVKPTSWPWSPLPTEALQLAAGSAAPKPLTFVADGLGLVVARSSWQPDATHISFKAGDNFWSHSHLDQGAFTIFKGAPLAMDSGCYCGYGNDHHLNYTYQTIAHNTITVTAPQDDAPMPPRKDKEPRPIANDGGQRRVGSGWDLQAAPLDREDWERNRDNFHTGRLVRVLEEDGLLIALTDITAAYTNTQSRPKSFHHRVRRVEKAWRIFVYDRVSDVLVVYDDVESTRADYTKRWLLHSAHAPQVDGNRFVVERAAAKVMASIPRLEGEVLFPKAAQILTIGGPGFEYYVDGRNYDEGGKIRDQVARGNTDADPGAWRMELMPAVPSLEDRFLVVLRPSLGERPPLGINRIENGDGSIGCVIKSEARTLRLTYGANRLGVTAVLEQADGSTRSHVVEGDGQRAPTPSWLDRLVARYLED